ncbi:hypothetical protein F4811DRAFT_568352 [Daldinia bambusicola]|nr:hypothetical protein F4811DRAFT_568352 [Daldinia bambusicola]
MAPHIKDAVEEDAPPPYTKHPTDGTATIATGSQHPPPFTPQAPSHPSQPQPHPQPQSQQIPQQPQLQPQPQPPIPRQFPPAFNLYLESGRHFHIGEHQASPLYAVSLARSAFSSKPDVLLHCGPGPRSPPLAAVERLGFDRCLTVTLPPLVPGAGVPRALERVETPTGLLDGPYTFVVETGAGAGAAEGLRREPFAWRRSRAEMVGALGGRSSGWKLVRLRTDAPSGLDGRGAPAGGARARARAGDGREVVAVWAWATASLTKKLRFRFLGSGASGVLGERWAVMAVATALWIFERERRQRENRAH